MKKVIIVIAFSFLLISVYSQSCLPEGITFETQAQVDNFQTNYPGCSEIEGNVIIGGSFLSDISNLNGLNELTTILGNLDIALTNYLDDLTGLNKLTSIGGKLTIAITGIISFSGLENLNLIEDGLSVHDNHLLENISALANLNSIGGNLFMANNNSLSDITGLSNLVSIGGNISIYDNAVLINLTGLDNIASIGGGISISKNENLMNITGLKNINPLTITYVSIYGNPLLSSCEVKSICDYLSSSGGFDNIDNNAPGCNSIEEVEEACESASVAEQLSNTRINLFPNPASQELIITVEGYSIDEVTIYTLTGQQLMKARSGNGILDISHLQPGMYIVEVMVEGRRIRQKLLVE